MLPYYLKNIPVVTHMLYLETLGNGPIGAPIASSTSSSSGSNNEDIFRLVEEYFGVSNADTLYLILKEVIGERNDSAEKLDNKTVKAEIL